MPDHEIRFRAGWKLVWVDEAGQEFRENFTLPIHWSAPLLARSLIRLDRSFQRPPVDREFEAVFLRVADAPGLVALKLNNESIVEDARDFSEMHEIRIERYLDRRNSLELVVDRAEARKQTVWGRVSLVIRRDAGHE